ncbi:MAG: HD domain-containing phosphohydrolase [Oceanidesulfovibrio sp.]
MESHTDRHGGRRSTTLESLRAMLRRPAVERLVGALTDGAGAVLVAELSDKLPVVAINGQPIACVAAAQGAEHVAALLAELTAAEHPKTNDDDHLAHFAALAEEIASLEDCALIRDAVEERGKRLFGGGLVEVCVADHGAETLPGDGSERTLIHPVSGNSTACIQRIGLNGRTLGEIRYTTLDSRCVSEREAHMLTTLAAQAAGPLENARQHAKLSSIMETIEELNLYEDVDTVLDALLLHARRLAGADAGSIYLVEEGALRFSYVHNDTLFGSDIRTDKGKAAVYRDDRVAMDESSIVGYVAATGQTLVIDDAYALPPDSPFAFNIAFDHKSGYRTKSILTIPLKSFGGDLLGVMQIINARDDDGRVTPFGRESMTYIPLFANKCTVILERSMMTRERILRLMKLAELRDPKETGAHVQRVGAYAAEIYRAWAERRKVPSQERKRYGDLIRVAAMLHDVGKVGIADAILKKPGRLDDDEFEAMKMHPIFGAQVFQGASPALDRMCFDIALHHHERYDGAGYPGRIPDVMRAAAPRGEPLAGEDIPLAARIGALADVYDALCSKRVYKDAWPEERVLGILEEQKGAQFDPELVDCFLSIQEVVQAIRMKYQDDMEH